MGRASSWALVAALAGFLFGFDTAVISGAEQAIQHEWGMSAELHGLAISSALWGTVIGALAGGWPMDRWGRRKTLIGIGVLYAISAIGAALAWDPWSFMVFRFVGGIGIGASSVCAPAYIAEIAPAAQRGRLVALFQTMIVTGILISFASNWMIGSVGEFHWRWMLGVVALPAFGYLMAAVGIPESPRWLLIHREREEEARAILTTINPANVDQTLAAIRKEAAEDARSISWGQFFDGHLNRPIMLAFLIALFNQMSGINAVLYFAPRIFAMSGAGASTALLATVGIGAVNLVFTLLGLILIDRAGRKPLMYVGSIGYIISLSMIGYAFATGTVELVMPFIFAFIAAHAVGQGAVIWVYISEIFPSVARAKGQSLGAGTHWVVAAALTMVMPVVLVRVHPALIFFYFAGAMILQLIWVRFAMVETRGRPLEQVAAELTKH